MREKKLIGILGSFLLVLVIIACAVFLQQKEKKEVPGTSTTTVQQREKTTTTEEKMTEAPKDTSDWEIEKPLEEGETTENQNPNPGVQ
ncbi:MULTISPECIES: hypothetical protein [Anaerostipes]|uniref:hypothetical protein n=1 Tax=Anaerostipes TaxID=207244 RepID=UPI000E5214CA|nr:MULTISPECIES: hypothetical protein [Anaerostipes]RGH23180.1 hypothetical protein DWV34_08605 [Anaerostipes sp. AF04-45]